MLFSVLLAVGVATTWYVLDRTGRETGIVPLSPPPDSVGSGDVVGMTPRPPAVDVVTSAPAPREAIGDGDDVPTVASADFDELRFVIAGMGLDSVVLGSDVRDSVLARPGTYLRFRTEAARREFLEARFPCPLEAGMPRDDPPGTRLDTLFRAIEAAGFEALYRKPMLRIGPRQAGSADGPR